MDEVAKFRASLFDRRDTWGLLLLLAFAFLGNYFRWTLFFDIDFLFGSIAVWLVVCLYGLRWGVLAGFISGICTYLIWHHPYTTLTFTVEPLVVGWLFRRRQPDQTNNFRTNIVLLDAIFWLFVGMPLVWLFYALILKVDSTQAVIILLKQPVNGIFNALVASLLLTYLPLHRWVSRPPAISTLSLQQTLFNLLVAFVMGPILMLIILSSHRVVYDIKNTARLDLNDASRYLIVEVQTWYQRRLNAIDALAQITLQNLDNPSALNQYAGLTKKIFADFRHIHILNAQGEAILNIDAQPGNQQNPLSNQVYFQQLQRSPQILLTPIQLVSGSTPIPTMVLAMPLLKGNQLAGAVISEIDLRELTKLLQANVGEQPLDLTLIDQNGTVVASTQPQWIGKPQFDWRQRGAVEVIGEQTYHWFPEWGSRLVMVKWNDSLFVKESRIDPQIPWTLIVQLAARNHVQQIERIHTQNMLILLLVATGALVVATFVSRQLVQPVTQLAQITTNLPNKLLDRQPLAWMQSQITEFSVLIANARSMAATLQQKFGEIQQVNETLEQRVQERTRAIQQMAERERLLGAIALKMRQSLQLDDVLTTMVAQVRQFLQADRVIVYQFQPDWSGLVLVESVAPGWRLLLGQHLTDTHFVEKTQQYRQGDVIAVDNIHQALLSDCHLELMEQLQVQASLIVPILQGEVMWGLLVAHQCCNPRQWQPSEIDFLKQLAIQAAIAIQQSELYQHEQRLNTILEQQVEERTAQLQQALRYEALLKRMTDKVRDSLDENQILQTAVEELVRGLEVYSCDTALFDLLEGTMTISHSLTQDRSVSHPDVSAATDFSDIYPQLLQGHTIQFCELVPRTLDPDWQPRTVLACPIVDDQGVLGKLRLFQPHDVIFSESEIRVVLQVANQCAIAIRQARLYQVAQVKVKALEELNQLKDDFLSTVSHELRTPISNMRMAIHMLQVMPTEERRQRYMEILQAECSREAELINDLLDLQRVASGTRVLELEVIDLPSWVKDLLEPFDERTRNRQQQLQVNLDLELSTWISDRSCLSRVLAELLNNACKYTPPGETIALSVRSMLAPTTENSESAPWLQLAVRNTGVEIPANELPRIFEKFYRIPGGDRWKQGGTGLGLALVQKLVEHVGGTIRAESGANNTCFIVELHRQELLPVNSD